MVALMFALSVSVVAPSVGIDSGAGFMPASTNSSFLRLECGFCAFTPSKPIQLGIRTDGGRAAVVPLAQNTQTPGNQPGDGWLAGLSAVPQKDPDAPPGWLVVAGRAGGALAGAWAAALMHEVGHAVVTWGYGLDFEWPTDSETADPFLPLWRVRGDGADRPSVRRNIAAGGFIISGVLSEALLASDVFPKNDVFVGGFLLYSILNSVVYTVTDIIEVSRGNDGFGDIRDMERGGIPRSVIYSVLLTSSALHIVRLLENPEFIRFSFWSSSVEPP